MSYLARPPFFRPRLSPTSRHRIWPVYRCSVLSSQSGRRRITSSANIDAQKNGPNPPKTILIVNKSRTPDVLGAIERLHSHIRTRYPGVKVFHEAHQVPPVSSIPWSSDSVSEKIDLVVTLGGDGTILHASSLFNVDPVPPVLSFSMGTLGFLLPFHVDDFSQALESVFQGTYTLLWRMRLRCAFHDARGNRLPDRGEGFQVMNEVALHRSISPGLNIVDVFVDGQHLTESVSDGIIVSTPTGSTAYSLSAGGPIVHPTMNAIILTPICPRSLSFRPLVFPSTSSITLRIGNRSRGPAGTYMDGQETRPLKPGDSITVSASPYPLPCINRSSIPGIAEVENDYSEEPSGEDDWVRDINSLLQYNATFRSKALLKLDRS